MSTTWKKITCYPDYEVNEGGQIRSWRSMGRPGSKKKERPSVLKAGLNWAGYPIVFLSNGHVKQILVHRLVLETFVGPCPPGQEACHYNGDRSDARLSNLRWDTREGNKCDELRHGTRMRGTMVPTSKLTEEEVLEIRADCRTHRTIAKNYSICHTQVSRIKRHLHWAWLKD